MESRYLDGSSRRSPTSVLTGVSDGGRDMLGTARARRKDPGSLDPGDKTARQGAPA